MTDLSFGAAYFAWIFSIHTILMLYNSILQSLNLERESINKQNETQNIGQQSKTN